MPITSVSFQSIWFHRIATLHLAREAASSVTDISIYFSDNLEQFSYIIRLIFCLFRDANFELAQVTTFGQMHPLF